MRSVADQRATPPRSTTRKARTRRLRRTLTRVDLWGVLRFSIVFYLCVFVILLVAGALLWAAARGAGVIDNVEDFIDELFSLDDFHFVGRRVLVISALAGGALVVIGTLVSVLGAMLFNLISALIGGVDVEVIEQDEASKSVV
jgi:transmembrane protein DUF3566